jgi:hypothetical protein
MRTLLVVSVVMAVLVGGGCGGAANAPEPSGSASGGSGSGSEGAGNGSGARGAGSVAGHDEVCHAHDGSLDRPCAEGLSCCYPCGTDGCDSVCHTPEECQVDQMRPSAPPP